MKNKTFIAQLAIGAIVYAVLVFFAHAVTGAPANWTLEISGLVAYAIAVVASRAIISL